VSELCQILSETSGKHRALQGHADAHRCCGKSLIESALVRYGVRQCARPESISKRAPSTTRTSLHLESTTCSRKPIRCLRIVSDLQVSVETCDASERRTSSHDSVYALARSARLMNTASLNPRVSLPRVPLPARHDRRSTATSPASPRPRRIRTAAARVVHRRNRSVVRPERHRTGCPSGRCRSVARRGARECR
jgi:hypothetical protein